MYQIVKGDSLQGLSEMEANLADLALIDPPYFDYKTGHRKDKNDKRSQSLVQQSQQDQLDTVQQAIRVLKDGRPFYFFTNWQEAWWFQQRFHTFLRNEIIWDKGNWTAGDLEGSFGNRYEVIFLGIKGRGWTYKGSRIPDIWGNTHFKDTEYSRYDLNRVGNNRIHSTEKPVDLYKMIIEISTDPGALIIDPYGGSGSSAEAAIRTNRNILAWEIDEEYHRRIVNRLSNIS